MKSIDNIDIKELLPQQPPFVMVDQLKYFDETKITTSLTITSDNIFLDKGLFTESGVTENIAQTCAARMGYINKYILNDGVKLGFIGEIKNLIIERLPTVDETIMTTVDVQNEVLSTLLVKAQVMIDDELIASCSMKIFMTEIDKIREEDIEILRP